MMVLIVGGSGSGKSEFAEQYVLSLSGEKKKYYLATMQVFDAEGQKKVERHQKLRAGKGFYTLELPVSVGKAAKNMAIGEKTALLECMSNLVANEMFDGTPQNTPEVIISKIIGEIKDLNQELTHLVIVSNNIFEGGISYDMSTMDYIFALGEINQCLAAVAEEVIEVTAGIPVWIKKGQPHACF